MVYVVCYASIMRILFLIFFSIVGALSLYEMVVNVGWVSQWITLLMMLVIYAFVGFVSTPKNPQDFGIFYG